MSRNLSTAPDYGMNVGEMQAASLSMGEVDPLALETTTATKTTRRKKTETE